MWSIELMERLTILKHKTVEEAAVWNMCVPISAGTLGNRETVTSTPGHSYRSPRGKWRDVVIAHTPGSILYNVKYFHNNFTSIYIGKNTV